jgi:hypothetical protein
MIKRRIAETLVDELFHVLRIQCLQIQVDEHLLSE